MTFLGILKNIVHTGEMLAVELEVRGDIEKMSKNRCIYYLLRL